jgi:Flp pilus assembly protein TadG
MSRRRHGAGRASHPDEGTAAVEMALLLPVLVLLLGGIIDFGFVFNAQISLTHAAREGVRVEAIGTGDAVGTALNAFTAPGVLAGTTTASVTQGCGGGGGGQARVQVTSQYSFFVLPFGDRVLQGQAVMRCGG